MKHRPWVSCSIVLFASLGVVMSQPFAAGSPSGAAQARSDRGSAIFRKSCSVCHSTRPDETKVGPSLYGVLREGSGHSEQEVRRAIADGKGTMPPFKEKLEPPDVDDLIEYLKTL